ncbi:efflux RND transporter periplasmic adaptor subunit [Paenibacillus sp. SYP-B4298]|uniref:efflux RND transporter periplasmic adaptor subunit n=1 Tax=Paenibacillus sp. SYP-B4298 TaxID=2996034 RepID=UPI0022DE6695|nr:efflux RND transporter periplasmic adaptor subunit [Paenibacillus sp. SYP-B4298]
MRSIRWNTLLAAGIIAGMLLLSGCTEVDEPSAAEKQSQEERQTPVQVKAVTQGALTQQSELIGSAVPSTAVDVFPKMTGEIIQLDVKKGDRVKKGQRLGRIKGDDLQTQVEMEEYALEIAQNQYKVLVRSEMTTDTELEQARISVEQSKLRLRQTRAQLENTYITTPFAGEIVNVNGELGGFASPSSPLFTVVSIQPIKITANVSSSQMLVLQNKTEIQVDIPDLGAGHTGTISYLSPVTNDTGFYTLEVRLANEDQAIKPGMIAKLLLTQERQQDALLVPTEAVVEKGGASYLFVIEKDRAVMKNIEVLETQSSLTAVKGDIQPGDLIVTKGQITLEDGMKVTVVEGAQKP